MERFSEHAREAIRIAHVQARQLCHPMIGQEHLLLGLISVEKSRAVELMRRAGLDPAEVRRSVDAACPPGDARPARRIARTADAKAAMHQAAHEARQQGTELVGSEHLLLGILRVNGKGKDILAALGLTAERVEQALAGQ